jgi:hypothetical protein
MHWIDANEMLYVKQPRVARRSLVRDVQGTLQSLATLQLITRESQFVFKHYRVHLIQIYGLAVSIRRKIGGIWKLQKKKLNLSQTMVSSN